MHTHKKLLTVAGDNMLTFHIHNLKGNADVP
jgi:hypothetical protein